MFTIRTRSETSHARTGTLHLAHGDVRTPAFIPLATKGTVKTLETREVARDQGIYAAAVFQSTPVPGASTR